MKKPSSYFDDLENSISFSYQNFGNSIQYFSEPYSPEKGLGYCYKYSSDYTTIYTVVTGTIGKPETDRRIKAHELGHIILGHLTTVYEELDSRVLWTINNDRASLVKGINENLGIDYADKLLNRIIDDPSLNHELHNIAMDFEVNQQILSPEDIEEMEKEISEYELNMSSTLKKLSEVGDEETIEKYKSNYKIKLMLPERYHLPSGDPFPTDLTYPEYLLLIIKNLDQFVKMLVSFKNGGNGDTSEVTEGELKEALSGGECSLDNLLDSLGLGEGAGSENKGCRDDADGSKEGGGGQEKNGRSKDHCSDSRDDADKLRKEGRISPTPSKGCGNSGGSDGSISVSKDVDPVNEAIDEVIRNFRSKVLSFSLKKDLTYLYNRGINREVIAPTYHVRAKLTKNPKIVFLLDVSGSMDKNLVLRILKTISLKMKSVKKGLKYDIISWNTMLSEIKKDMDPNKPIPRIRTGGGTRMAKGIEYFRDNYDKSCVMVLISDFEDYLDEWEKVTSNMSGYDLYGFCYGWQPCKRTIKNFKIRNFNES